MNDPAPYLTRVLGAEPHDPDKVRTWRSAASAIEKYRAAYGVTDQRSALGVEPHGNHRQWIDHQQATRQALDARERLGLSRSANQYVREPTPPSLAIERGGRGRGISR